MNRWIGSAEFSQSKRIVEVPWAHGHAWVDLKLKMFTRRNLQETKDNRFVLTKQQHSVKDVS